MTFMDLISLISLLLSVASFATSSVGKFAAYKNEFMAVGYFLFGFVISRLLYTYLPLQTVGEFFSPRFFVWALILGVMAIIVLTALKREGTHYSIWVIMVFFILISFNGKYVGLIDNFKLRENEFLSIVEIDEKSGDFDRAIEILTLMKDGRNQEEIKTLDTRISAIKLLKTEKLSHPLPLQLSK